VSVLLFLTAFVLGIFIGVIGIVIWSVYPYFNIKIGDIVYLKPTMERCIVYHIAYGEYYLKDMQGNNIGFRFNKKMLLKVENDNG
jgi:cytochrome b subunit of formate dehydrogenase